MTAYVLTCDEANVGPSGGGSTGGPPVTCSAPYYAPAPSFIPPISASDGGLIAVAILAVWAIAWGWKVLHRAG